MSHQEQRPSTYLSRVLKRWYIHLFLFPFSLPIEYLAFINQPDQVEKRRKLAEKEQTHLDSLSEKQKDAYLNQKSRKWKLKVFWVVVGFLALTFYSLTEQYPWASWLGFLVLFVGIWIYPKKEDNAFFVNHLTNFKAYKGRMASSVGIFVITLIIFIPLISEALEEQRELKEQEFVDSYPEPTIKVLSEEGDQGESKDYELRVRVSDATLVYANNTEMIQGSKDKGLYTLNIPLDTSKKKITIEAVNDYKQVEEEILISRAETEEEKEVRLAAEAKQAEELAQKEVAQKALEEKIKAQKEAEQKALEERITAQREQQQALESYGTGEFKLDAYVCAQLTVPDLLKSPSSAKFPHADYKQVVSYEGNDKYTVESYVDAQNSFGAMIRTNYRCDLVVTGHESCSGGCVLY